MLDIVIALGPAIRPGMTDEEKEQAYREWSDSIDRSIRARAEGYADMARVQQETARGLRRIYAAGIAIGAALVWMILGAP